jgi:hypothetical protein
MNTVKTTLEVLNTDTGQVIKLSRHHRRLRDKVAKSKEKPRSVVEINKLRTEHLYKIKAVMKPLERFLSELLEGWIHYVTEDSVEVPVVVFDNGHPSTAEHAFDLCFEYCYQILRFTKSSKALEYRNESISMKIYFRTFCRDGEEILKSEIIKVKQFLLHTKEILLKVPFDVATRVRDEISKITDPKVQAGLSFTTQELRTWLEDIGR